MKKSMILSYFQTILKIIKYLSSFRLRCITEEINEFESSNRIIIKMTPIYGKQEHIF